MGLFERERSKLMSADALRVQQRISFVSTHSRLCGKLVRFGV